MPRYHLTCDPEPRYLPQHSSPADGVYRFAYTITIRNAGEVAAQLIARHWEVEDAEGRTQVVDGLGVVGQQPLLQPGEVFRYTSSVELNTPMGVMSGHYFCVAVDGTRFEAVIAPFVLKADGPRLH
jgi:ApaG protein